MAPPLRCLHCGGNLMVEPFEFDEFQQVITMFVLKCLLCSRETDPRNEFAAHHMIDMGASRRALKAVARGRMLVAYEKS